MAQTADKPKREAGLPMDEPIMIRYSPHHEFPLSTVISSGLHVLVIVLLIIGGILVAKLNWGGDAKPPPSNAVAMESPAGGGGGNPNGVGNGPGDGATGDPEAPDAPLEDPDEQVVVGKREQLQDAKKELLQLDEFKDEEGKRLIEEGGKEVTKILNLKSDVRKKLNAGLAAGKGQGGSGSGGGRGGGRGTGTGDDVGPGTGDSKKRAERPLRWTLIFNTRDGKDYRKQLQAFGAILAIPDPKSADGYLVIRDLENPKAHAEDIAKIERIYWIDDKPASVRSLSSALDMPPPGHFIVFFPREFEDKLLRLELGYRGKQEGEITETRFEVRRFENTYEPYVISQR
jgi:hypothetical protein